MSQSSEARRAWALSVGEVFARRVRERREAVRMPQQAVATIMVVLYGHTSWRQTTVGKVETGERQVQLAEAVALAEILGVSLTDLIGDPNG